MSKLNKYKLNFDIRILQEIINEYIKNIKWKIWENENWYEYIPIVENGEYKNKIHCDEKIKYFIDYFRLPIIKARISKTINDGKPWPSQRGWHRDPSLKKEIRILIPISGCEHTGIEFLNSPPEKTEIGYFYFFNTSQYHRIWCDMKKIERICLLLCFDNSYKENFLFYKKYFNNI